MAPSISPPENRCISGLYNGIGLNAYRMPVNIATLPSTAMGTCHVITRFHKRYTNPISNANALISPSEPLSIPTNMFCNDGIAIGSCLKFAKTVADETPSMATEASGAGHVVICAGKDISRNIRPTSAGLKILFPNPPNDILPIPIAAKAPIATIHIGRSDGKLNASSTPVMIADPSHIFGSLFIMNRAIRYSNSRQKRTDAAVNTSASKRNTYSATKNAGIRAMSTPYMFFVIESPLCICGDGETVN